MKARKVLARWPVAPGGAPVGMTIDTAKHRLLIGCRKPQKLIVMSTENGKIVADLPIGADSHFNIAYRQGTLIEDAGFVAGLAEPDAVVGLVGAVAIRLRVSRAGSRKMTP